MWQALFNAIFREDQALANSRELARHLARIPLFELKGLDMLYPDVKEKAERLISAMSKQGMYVELDNSFRSALWQDKLFAQGRTAPGNVVTAAHGLESYHQYGLAFDLRFVKYGWNPPAGWWEILGKEGEKLGLTWGGTFQDYSHFEWHPGFDWKSLKGFFQRSQ